MPKIADLKSTLNLPHTDFPMKAGLPQNEPKQLVEWEAKNLYHRIQQARAGAPTYVLHDGPPYPTGTIHLGTGLNKILKDMVVKSKTMAGFRAPYVPGWDCHGLPIETQVEKELGGKKASVPPGEFRRMCREFASRYVDQHRRDFKRLGVFGQWEDPYLTMSPQYEATIADAFITFLEKGYVYRGLKPVYWCIVDSTALAEAEVEYETHTSPSIWVKFAVEPGAAAEKLGSGVSAVIWTTTPWTLPHNRALAFHPDYDYVVAETSAGALLLAADLVGPTLDAVKLEATSVRGPWKGRDLTDLKFLHPFLDLTVPAVLADYVTLDQGTGIVHTAPGHGVEDFQTGQKYGIEAYAPIDDHGRYLEGLPEYKGKTVFQANPIVVELLRERGALLGEQKLSHSYPHCWRCHNPVIFRATEQWFINLDGAGADAGAIRPRALAEIAKVKWTPEWGAERIRSMIAERPDWCVSRQRFWGVPLTILYCTVCGKQFDDYATLHALVEKWFKKEGADAWFTHSVEELLPAGVRCSCGASSWRKETDILDVWFDSGSSHLAVLNRHDAAGQELPWPADMYLEGPDQFRGWFQSSLLVGVAVRNGAPYRQVLTHGWTLDAKGQPMSKSLGNVVLPTEICEKWGADLLRLWVASQEYTADVRMSDNVMTQLSEAYRKLRNTFRFALGNLADFDPASDAVPDAEMEELDRWMLSRAANLVAQCRNWYEAFEFHRVFHALHDFAVVDLSAFYFDVLKDRLYTFAPKNHARRSAQTAVYRISKALLGLLTPITVFTAEEIWKYFPRVSGDPQSAHLALFAMPEALGSSFDAAKAANWEKLLLVRTEVLRALEAARNAKTISGALQAKIVLSAGKDLAPLLEQYKGWLAALFIVSQVELADTAPADAQKSEMLPGLSVAVQRADGAKCERCWNYSTHVGESATYPTVCERCVKALAEIEATPGHEGSQGAASS
ncbi:MAG TPA: isoleucine--tRNA ligase [Candidatus Acidoferrales bacterium]|nr:isoleucine--tRNA ligase [Candidatus Acidoferrales bacterium]